MLSPLEFVAATLIMAVGSAFQAAVGLGLALLVVPFLALIDTRFIPGPMLFAGIALTAATAYRDRREIDRAALGLSFAGLQEFINMPAARVSLNTIDLRAKWNGGPIEFNRGDLERLRERRAAHAPAPAATAAGGAR